MAMTTMCNGVSKSRSKNRTARHYKRHGHFLRAQKGRARACARQERARCNVGVASASKVSKAFGLQFGFSDLELEKKENLTRIRENHERKTIKMMEDVDALGLERLSGLVIEEKGAS